VRSTPFPGRRHPSLRPLTHSPSARHTSPAGSRRALVPRSTAHGPLSGRAPFSDGYVVIVRSLSDRLICVQAGFVNVRLDRCTCQFRRLKCLPGRRCLLQLPRYSQRAGCNVQSGGAKECDGKDGWQTRHRLHVHEPPQFTSTTSTFVLTAGGVDVTAKFLSPVEVSSFRGFSLKVSPTSDVMHSPRTWSNSLSRSPIWQSARRRMMASLTMSRSTPTSQPSG
jgi:hypothetical protein